MVKLARLVWSHQSVNAHCPLQATLLTYCLFGQTRPQQHLKPQWKSIVAYFWTTLYIIWHVSIGFQTFNKIVKSVLTYTRYTTAGGRTRPKDKDRGAKRIARELEPQASHLNHERNSMVSNYSWQNNVCLCVADLLLELIDMLHKDYTYLTFNNDLCEQTLWRRRRRWCYKAYYRCLRCRIWSHKVRLIFDITWSSRRRNAAERRTITPSS